jgi:hypothetical protein
MKTYTINRAIGRPIEFKGLKAQYLTRFFAIIVSLLFGITFLHLLGVHPVAITILTLAIGGVALKKLYGLSNAYGQYGLMKQAARRKVPKALTSRSRSVFIQLYQNETKQL